MDIGRFIPSLPVSFQNLAIQYNLGASCDKAVKCVSGVFASARESQVGCALSSFYRNKWTPFVLATGLLVVIFKLYERKVKSEVLKREQALQAKEIALADREAAVRLKETALADREAAVRLKETALADREAVVRPDALADREAAVRLKETALADRERAVNEKEELLKKLNSLVEKINASVNGQKKIEFRNSADLAAVRDALLELKI